MEGAASLVGREAELAAIEDALDALAAGTGGVILLSGEPGIGKSRLAAELAARASARGHRVAHGRGSELETAVPYGAVVVALEPLAEQLDPGALADRHRRELAELLPGLVDDAAAPGADGFEAERFRLHRAVAALLEELAADGLVVVLDDVHWLDEGSAELVAHLLRRPPDAPVLLVLAARTGQEPAPVLRAIADAASDGAMAHVELGPLAPAVAAGLLGDALDAPRREVLLRESGGNPFYLLELAAAVRAGPLPSRAPGIGELVVPAAVRMAIAGELEALSDDARLLVRAAAVAGDPFDTELAIAVAELDPCPAATAIDELVERDLVRATDTPYRLAFRHPIVRRAVYEWAGAAWRTRAHEQAAAELAQRDGSAIARAPHVERSARPGDADAVAVLAEAARACAARSPGTAARWYGVALGLLPEDADPGERLGLLISHAVALGSVGRTAQAREALVDALALVPPDWAAARATLIVNVARVENILGRFGAARALLTQALRETSDRASSATLRLELGAGHWYAKEWDELGACAIAALEHGRALGDAGIEAEAAAHLAIAEYGRGQPRRASRALDEAEATGVRVRQEQIAMRPEILLHLGYATHALERYEASAELFVRLREIARDTGQGYFLVPALVGTGAARVWLGRYDEAAADAEDAVAAAQLLDNEQARMWALTSRAFLAYERGDADLALRSAQAAVDALAATPNAMFDTLAPCYLGAARWLAGDVDGGIALLLEHGGRTLQHLEIGWRPYWAAKLAVVERERGDRRAAEQWVARAEGWARHVGLAGRRADALQARATLALADEDAAAALAAADAAAQGFRAVGRTVDAARADALAGRAQALAGAGEAATERLDAAHHVFAAAGAIRDRDAAAAELRRLGVRVAQGRGAGRPAKGIAALSDREREVVALVAQGLTNRQIADELFLSPKTVEHHLSRIFAKVGVRSRTALARAAQERRD